MADLVIQNAQLYSPGLEVSGDAVAVKDGLITWIGASSDSPAADETLDVEGRWLTPGLIDCHTHLVFAGSRSNEFEARLSGATYQEIAAQGGGILSTVKATRAASYEALLDLAQSRVRLLASQGVTTLDVKSGYGLDVETEIKCLNVAGALKGPRIIKGFLGAHSVPPEFKPDSDAYLDHVIAEMLPVAEPLCDYVDAFCESVAFSPKQVERLFSACRRPVRLHADQLSDSAGGALAARHRALSADHLEYVSDSSLAEMAEAGTIAVLLPGAYYMLREPQAPPVQRMRELGVKMAVSTDLNPGTSPITSLPLVMNMTCLLFGLTVEEAWQGVTLHAAAALGHPELGRLSVGSPADLALWLFDHPRDLVGTLGSPCLARSWVAGRPLK